MFIHPYHLLNINGSHAEPIHDCHFPSLTSCSFRCKDLTFPVMSVCCLFRKEENKVAERNNLRTACLPFALSFQTVLNLWRVLEGCSQQILISDFENNLLFHKMTPDRNLNEKWLRVKLWANNNLERQGRNSAAPGSKCKAVSCGPECQPADHTGDPPSAKEAKGKPRLKSETTQCFPHHSLV